MQSYQPVFVGRCGGEFVTFVKTSGQGFAILRGAAVVHAGTAADVEAGMDLFLTMIERPAAADDDSPPRSSRRCA